MTAEKHRTVIRFPSIGSQKEKAFYAGKMLFLFLFPIAGTRSFLLQLPF
jgi:hypothetical protein